MAVSPVNAAVGGQAASALADRLPARTLSQDDFLQLVVAQMTSQDPLNPKLDTDFVAQMAQFTTLEQTRSMQNDLASLRAEQQILRANALLGRVVALEDAQGALISGLVSAVKVVEGTPFLVVNGRAHDLSALLSIEPAPDPNK
jgi:flagellar basal-body rod modification protein FlgD